jgi:hypothetical protein
MRRMGTAVIALGAAAMLGARLSADELQPGLKPGDSPGSFNIKEAVGPDESFKGKSFCYT